MARQTQIEIAVAEANALDFKADVLILKYADAFFGLCETVAAIFTSEGGDVNELIVNAGDSRLLDSRGAVSANKILMVGVTFLPDFQYGEIREFAHRALLELRDLMPDAKRIAFTLHGANYGLDEIEAFEAEIAGILDGINRAEHPKKLERIFIIERNSRRANRLKGTLFGLIPQGKIDTETRDSTYQIDRKATKRLLSAGYATESKPHIFVAMPFKEDMDDVYDYGIAGAVRAAGFVCERADLTTFTGDVLAWVKKRIRTSTLVVADLTEANPNVYLEVGYAWGVGIRTVLIVKDTSHLKFDVQSQRCIPYKRIKDLEIALTKELTYLRSKENIEPIT